MGSNCIMGYHFHRPRALCGFRLHSEVPLSPSLNLKLRGFKLASFPVPRPAFRRLQYGTASDEKLGVGLGTRLGSSYILWGTIVNLKYCSIAVIIMRMPAVCALVCRSVVGSRLRLDRERNQLHWKRSIHTLNILVRYSTDVTWPVHVGRA